MAMLTGAMAELGVGNPDRLSVDVGPVITAEAQQRLVDHIEHMRAAGHAIHQAALPAQAGHAPSSRRRSSKSIQ